MALVKFLIGWGVGEATEPGEEALVLVVLDVFKKTKMLFIFLFWAECSGDILKRGLQKNDNVESYTCNQIICVDWRELFITYGDPGRCTTAPLSPTILNRTAQNKSVRM
jgi:hypothetical protein